jgi:septal ring factor EnvC (AmiA/AmiB activator)
MGGSIAISLATAGLAFMVMTTKTRYTEQLRAVESSLTGGKFAALGLPYTGNFMENEAEPAATIAKAGTSWAATSDDLKDTKGTLDKTKVELTESKAKTQELSLTAEKLTKDLSSTKNDLEATNSKLKVTSEQLQAYNDELKGKKPSELFAQINELGEKVKVSDSENKMLTAAKEKLDQDLKKLRDQIEMSKPGGAKNISLSGKIVAVNPTWNFVILDLGKNDQVVEGLTMVIYRGEKLVGKIKTVTVDAQTSVADVLPGTPATAIEVGDQVVY